jgi:hypothetical protein
MLQGNLADGVRHGLEKRPSRATTPQPHGPEPEPRDLMRRLLSDDV